MKMVVSIPGDVYAKAEELAQLTKKSRSELYSAAIREYMERHSSDSVTNAMNSALDEIGIEVADPFAACVARRTLARIEW